MSENKCSSKADSILIHINSKTILGDLRINLFAEVHCE